MPIAIIQAKKRKFFRTSQNIEFPFWAPQKTPIVFQGQPSSFWPSCTLRSGCGSALGTFEADIVLCMHASTCCWPASIIPAPFGLWADPCSASYGGSSFSRKEVRRQSCCCLRCKLLEQIQNMVCLHTVGSHPPAEPAEAEAPEAPNRREGSPVTPQKCNFANFSNYYRTLQKLYARKLIILIILAHRNK